MKEANEQYAQATAGPCCGGPAPAGISACCVKDANAKAAGRAGCGCGGVSAGVASESSASAATRAFAGDDALPVAVIGAGPVGLAAAARLIERGIEPIVLEAAASVGANLLDYGHVRLFSPWRYDVDPAMAEQLKAT